MAETFGAQCQCPHCGSWMNGLGVNNHQCNGVWRFWEKPNEEAQILFRLVKEEKNK